MSRLLFIDPFGGAAGDMLLGALVDLGVEAAELQATLAGLGLTGWRLEAARDRQQGFAGTRVRVVVEEESHPGRHLADVEELLHRASLPARVRERARAAFRRLFEAESQAHGVPLAETHLHELAAVDAVVDIVGVCAAVERLDVERVIVGPVPVGSGTVETAHGLLPVPGPAVARLLAGVPLAGHAADGEMTTPTGATLLVTLADAFGALPAGTLQRVGVGLGTRRFAGLPNILRAFLIEAEAAESLAGRPMAVVETTVDDVTGETLGFLQDRLRAAGALDVWCLAGTGRKGRPVTELRALCEPDGVQRVLAALFAEGVTLGARVVACLRPELSRVNVDVTTRFGVIPVKVGVHAGMAVSVKPEHDACTAAALRFGVSVAAIVHAAREAAPRIGEAFPEPAG